MERKVAHNSTISLSARLTKCGPLYDYLYGMKALVCGFTTVDMVILSRSAWKGCDILCICWAVSRGAMAGLAISPPPPPAVRNRNLRPHRVFVAILLSNHLVTLAMVFSTAGVSAFLAGPDSSVLPNQRNNNCMAEPGCFLWTPARLCESFPSLFHFPTISPSSTTFMNTFYTKTGSLRYA